MFKHRQDKDMINNIVRLCIITLTAFLCACANMGAGPQGGPKDENPPKCLSSTPTPNQKSYKGQKITLNFDEYVQLKDAYSKVVVSPPQSTPISISSLGKKVTVELSDSLEENRTYIIDFGNAIADNNEGNELNNYFISFSTGESIDSFEVAGKIIDAQTLAPVKGLYVGAYEDMADTAFTNTKMDYVAKTDENGNFRIRGLKEREYAIYALKDNNSNYKFDDKSEGIALLDTPVRTRRIVTTISDTTYKDSLTIDTIVTKTTQRFSPDTLIMRFFTEVKHLQYYKSAKWPTKDYFTLNFVNEKKMQPTITPINFVGNDWYRIETGVTFDTLTYWLTDTLISQKDTLLFSIDYEKTDSIGQFTPKKDTVKLIARKWKKDKKYKGPNFETPKRIDYFKVPILTWESPVISFNEQQLKLKLKRDTVWEDVDCKVEPLENQPRSYKIIATYEEDGIYKLTVDSGLVRDLNGISNKEKCESQFKIRNKSEYTQLDLKIANTKGRAFSELLNQKEQVIRKEEVISGKVTFSNLEPGEYFVRLFEDRNNDGEWTTGDFKTKRAPEQMYYYPKKLTLRANWEREESWDVTSTGLLNQRPAELNNNASKDKKK